MGKGKRKINLHFSIRIWSASIAAVVWVSFVFPLPFPLAPGLSRTDASISDSVVVSTSTREGRLAVFDDAWSTINKRYYDPAFHRLARGRDWNTQRTIFRSQAADANSTQQLYAVLRRMIASLNDPHTRVYAPDEKFDWWRPRFVSIGIAIREIDGLPTIVKVERDSAPQRAGVRAGDVIETVDGRPALSLINSRLDDSTVSTSMRLRAFAKLLEGPAGTLVDVRWKRKDGSARSARFKRYWQQRELGLRVRNEKGDYAVVELDGFTKAVAADFARSLKEKIASSRGVIIDLRSNGGGDAEAMSDIASAFLGVGLSLGQFTDRDGSSFSITTRSRSPFLVERIGQTKLPLVVLTSERTSSAAEIFIAALMAAGRATIIGTETCGCVLAIRTRHNLPDGGLLDISELDYETAAGLRLEGHGVKPDETVVIERNDLYSGRDRAMESAISRLTRSPLAHDMIPREIRTRR
jgi:carboxyl-terminal processing protease